MLPTPAAAIVTIPPPAYADEGRVSWAAGAGWGVPEGTHLALGARAGALGGRLALGTQPGAQATVTGVGRYFLPAPLAGGFVGGGGTWPAGRPTEATLGFVEVGWQLRGPRWLLEVAAGPAPLAWGSSPERWLQGGNVGAPRLLLTGYYRF